MDNNKFNKFYAKKPISELIVQLRTHRITGTTMDKEWYEGLIAHLKERELSPETRKLIDNILSTDPETLRNEEKPELSLIEKETINNSKSMMTEKYPALSLLARFFIACGFIVGLFTIIITIVFIVQGKDGYIIAGISFVIGALIVISVLAIAELIKVIIDIEYNTRQAANKK